MKILVSLLAFALFAAPSLAMDAGGCGAGKCADCHSMTIEEAKTMFGAQVDRVLKVDFAEMPGVWQVEVEKNSQKFPIYVDFSKSYAVAGSIIRLKDGQDIYRTPQVARPANPSQIDISRIPLNDALLLGRKDAKTKVIVFTDPECPYCKKLHLELKEVVRRDPSIAFLIKLFPLKMHPNAYGISKSILCLKSLTMLENSFEGKPVPPALCETTQVDDNIALAAQLGINSTPTLILPDGRVFPGSRKADEILQLLGSRVAAKARK